VTAANFNKTKVLIFSEHDYRTARRANLHPIADALVKLGHEVTFISVRYSSLSLIKGDSRKDIRANTAEIYNGIECYLWRTLVHPFNAGRILWPVTAPLYWLYPRLQNHFIDEAIRSASNIIVESGLGAILLARIRSLNREAKLIYYASDDLRMIGAHRMVQRSLERSRELVDYVCVASRKMVSKFSWTAGRVYFVPHGINPMDFGGKFDSPYCEKLNGVSVGSGLFDPDFFNYAVAIFPSVQFHVIGSGARLCPQKNLHVYNEMPFTDTIPYIKHATFGIAAYRPKANTEHICDTSMKLMQYDYVGIPAVCTDFAVGDNSNRFGYMPGNARSIARAINAALAARDRLSSDRHFLTWDDVARRILNAESFVDTRLPALPS
jgi:2-beta-glucuronyltransferase